MYRRILQDQLAAAERHVVSGESHIARQAGIVAGLERNGDDVKWARRVLENFHHSQLRLVILCDQIRARLAECSR